ncbi:Hint domain-containing protein [Cypionkella sp.]|uniref:Hint domain-containing protein n=1 Tax=Cypionkella sp. TaxID=2811411 RepID=UPI002ABA2E60|nr:Hint domain-containing protein [Cypionkella sp.]MDZ4396010.1 Hint domain-containing protein [Cypionkella sp.]
MAVLNSGLGGTSGYGEQSFKTTGGYSGSLDDGSRLVDVSGVFGSGGMDVYGSRFTSLYINTNGLITFSSAQASYTPAALTTLGQPSIAPFWTDIDISKGGDIYWDIDATTGKITITWLNVAPYSGTGTNSFQVVITNLGGGDFGVDYLYNSVGFTNGYAGQATVGISNGSSSQTLLEGSGDAAFLSTYATNDFDTNDPAGVYSMQFEAGQAFLGDGVVDGTAGSDLIDTSYVGDPDGDRIDANDGTGYSGTTGQADYVLAGAGNDTVNSGLGNDIVYGGSGNDVVNAGTGNDTVYGDDGNDSLDGSSGNDSLFGGAGDDTLSGGDATTGTTYTPSYTEVTSALQSVAGTNGRPNFTVNTVSSDNDLTTGTSGAVSGFRLGNTDSVETHTHTASSQLAGGQIIFNAINSNETLTIVIDGVTINLNTAIASGMVTFNGNSTYAINAGGQVIRIGSGSTSTTTGTLTINTPYTTLALTSSGSTILTAAGLYYEYYPNTNPLNVAAEAAGDDYLSGGLGNDSLLGHDGNDTLLGDEGNDTLDGGNGNDSLSGGIGDDSLLGLAGSDTLLGGDGSDSLYGGADADSLSGDAGNDLLYGGEGNDTLNGGADNDTLFGDAGNDSLLGVTGDDSLFGGAGNDTLLGGDGHDSLDGGADADSLSGEAGNDTLNGGAGADWLYGGAGMDFAEYSSSGAGVNVDLIAGTGLGGDAQGDVLSGIDGIFGSAFDDTLLGYDGESTVPGDSWTNVLYGGAGNDSIDGRGGSDSLYGGTGNDTVLGGAGNDLLDGGDGNDQLFGGLGNDAVYGGAGNDTLDGGAGADTLYGGTGNELFLVEGNSNAFGDVIDGGENSGDDDVLDLSNWGWALTNIIYDPMNPENGTVEFLDGAGAVIGTLTFSNIENVIPCFTPGVMILTSRGDVAVEDLRAGDLLLTRDNGLQPIRWIGTRKLGLGELIAQPCLQPVKIGQGALGGGLPLRDTVVSPQHRMLIVGALPEMLFGEAEVLVAATHLTVLAGVQQILPPGVTYIHVLLDHHEIIHANGSWTESFQPAERMLDAMEDGPRAEIAALFPELSDRHADFTAARLTLKAHEAKVLLLA